MAGNLADILGGNWSPPQLTTYDPPEVQFRQAIMDAGLLPPDEIVMDGTLHRWRSCEGKALDRPGWYVLHGGDIAAGVFGCWKMGLEQSFRAQSSRRMLAIEEIQHANRIAEARRQRDADRERQYATAASVVETIWQEGAAASADHPYLARKRIQPHGVRVTGDGRLMVPLFSVDGELSSLQYIAQDGGKLYHACGQTGGRFWLLGTMDQPGTLYVAEGFATGATIHEVSGRPCVVAFSASNLVPTVGAIREHYGIAQDIVIVADNDVNGIGERYAEQASAKYGARYLMPPAGDANDFHCSGGDLLQLLNPPRDEWLVRADDLAGQPAPIKWIIKHWLQANALIMVHGPSGGGKTFVVLDACLRVASGLEVWADKHRVNRGTVVYLAGEGHHGLRSRLAAWKQRHGVKSMDMWLSQSGCDLNTPAGYRQVVEHVRQLPTVPCLIVVDTLHRFLSGDENSSVDAKTMLDACAGLMREFPGCSVLLVHHTGVSDEAQHRARGSSAWRGALDIEISVVPGTASRPIEVVQRKAKDSEVADPLYFELLKVPITGWLDEDGDQVSSAVLDVSGKPEKKPSDFAKDILLLKAIWIASGSEQFNGAPYLSNSAIKDYMVTVLEVKPASAEQYVKPSVKGKLVSNLILAGMIARAQNGWMVTGEPLRSSWVLDK